MVSFVFRPASAASFRNGNGFAKLFSSNKYLEWPSSSKSKFRPASQNAQSNKKSVQPVFVVFWRECDLRRALYTAHTTPDDPDVNRVWSGVAAGSSHKQWSPHLPADVAPKCRYKQQASTHPTKPVNIHSSRTSTG